MLKQRWILVVNRRKKLNLDSTLHQRYFTNVNATSTKRCWNNGEFWSSTDVYPTSTNGCRNNVDTKLSTSRPDININSTSEQRLVPAGLSLFQCYIAMLLLSQCLYRNVIILPDQIQYSMDNFNVLASDFGSLFDCFRNTRLQK